MVLGYLECHMWLIALRKIIVTSQDDESRVYRIWRGVQMTDTGRLLL